MSNRDVFISDLNGQKDSSLTKCSEIFTSPRATPRLKRFDLYEYIIITLHEICVTTNNDFQFYNNEERSWDSKTKTMVNGWDTLWWALDTFSVFLAKEMLAPMRPLVTTLQGRLVEVYTLVFTKLKKLLNIKLYTEIHNAIDLWFQGMYQIAVSLPGRRGWRPSTCLQ